MSSSRSLPEEISVVYKALRSEISWLHGRWICYKQLFAASPKRIDLLNESAGTFFYIIHYILLDEVQVMLSKLTDPARTKKFENLSLYLLQERIDHHADSVLASECQCLLDRLHEQCEPFRIRRNKQLAHLDLNTALKSPLVPLPDISRQMIEEALQTLRKYMNAIEGHYNDSEWDYEAFIMTSDGEDLVVTLRDGLRYEELVQKRKVAYDDWRLGKWHDA
jgi:hypothetical protein